MDVLILAAGLGTRMKEITKEIPKGLIQIAGREILFRNLYYIFKHSPYPIKNIVIVTNPKYKSTYLEFFEKFKKQVGREFNLKIVLNEFPEKGNGYSLFLAGDKVSEKFILLMSDHLYEEEFIKLALSQGKGLIVDKIGKFIDRDEATRVEIENGKVKKIGKKLSHFHAFDTGFFILDKSIFNSASKLAKEKEKIELSEVIECAKVPITEINGLFWMDVDTPEEKRKAEKLLIKLSVKSAGDGFVSRHLNRKISTFITSLIVNKVNPDEATIFTFLFGVFSALLVYVNLPLAGIAYQISSILDGIDGELARVKLKTSKWGGYFDSVLDRYVDFFFLTALATTLPFTMEYFLLFAFSLFGSVMVSYSTERYKGEWNEDIYKIIPEMRSLPGKRDERIFLIMCFCLVNQIKLLFFILAVLTNLRVIITLFLVWKYKKLGKEVR